MSYALEHTGERYVPWATGYVGYLTAYEHVHRYLFASQYVQGKRVLDISCGEGYGTAILARTAASVLGVDFDRSAVAHARQYHGKPNVHFVQADAQRFALAPGSLDVAVSFETLEHFEEHEGFIASLKTALGPEGLLIISTPNRRAYSDEPEVDNPFHQRELYRAEFVSLLQRHFGQVRLQGQGLIASSMIADASGEYYVQQDRQSGFLFTEVDNTQLEYPAQASSRLEPRYYIAFCSDAPLPPASNSLLVDNKEALLNYLDGVDTQVAERTTDLYHVTKQLAEEGTKLYNAQQQLAKQAADNERLQRDLDATAARLRGIEGRLSWRLLTKAWEIQMRVAPPNTPQGRLWLTLTRTVRAGLKVARPERLLSAEVEAVGGHNSYEEWARRCEDFRYNPARAARQIAEFEHTPVISLVMPTYNSQPEYLRKALDSVLRQYYPHWELCICDDGSPEPHVREVLAEYAARDARINVTYAERNGGIVAASNAALALATGEFVGLLDHDDELTPDALYEVAAALQIEDVDLLYSDEDKLDEFGRRCEPFLKPAWSPDLALSANCVSHFSVFRRRLLEQLGASREGYDGAQDYDLMLRFVEQAGSVAHIPKVLYHWRKAAGSAASGDGEKPWAFEAATRALADALARRGVVGEVEQLTPPGFYRIRRALTAAGKVSIIIPTRDHEGRLRRCIESIEAKTAYPDYEIIIVDNGSRDAAALEYLARTPHRVLRRDGPFNHSQLCNLAAAEAGAYLLLLHDDTEVLSAEWLSALVEHAQRPEVGAVGAKLRYPNGRVQHAGIVLGSGAASHYGGFVDGRTVSGYSNFGKIIRDCSAVSGACLMIRRDLFAAMNGLDESLAIDYNDIDLCLRLQGADYLVVFTPHALLRHHTATPEGKGVDFREAPAMVAAWGSRLANDPYYHPSLDAASRRFTLDLAKLDAWAYLHSHKVADGVVGHLGDDRVVGQEFQATVDGLCAVGVMFGTYRRRNGGTVRFHLRESRHADADLVLIETPAALIEDSQYHLFSFDPPPDSAGKVFYFYVELVEYPDDATLTLWRSDATEPASGPYYDNHLAREGTLTFNAYCLDRSARYSRLASVAPPRVAASLKQLPLPGEARAGGVH